MSIFIKNFVSLLFGNFTSHLISAITTIYLARTLGSGEFGKLSFSFALLSYALLLSNLGLTTLGTREVAKTKEKMLEYSSEILSLRIFLSLLSILLMSIFVFFLPKPALTKNLIIFLSFSLLPQALFLDWLFQGIEKMNIISYSRIIFSLSYFLMTILIIKNPLHLLRTPMPWFLANTISALFLLIFFVKNFGMPRFRLYFSRWKILLKISLPLGTAFIMAQIYTNFDTLLLGFIKTDKMVGWYNAAYKLIFFILLLDSIYGSLLFPLVSKLRETSKEKLTKVYNIFSKIILSTISPILIAGTILSDRIITLLFGIQYKEASPVFQILLWMALLTCINTLYTYGLIAFNHEKTYAFGIVLGGIINIFLNFILIPLFNHIGAAFSTVLAEAVMLTYMAFHFEKIFRVRFWLNLPPPLFSSIGMGLFLYLLREKSLFLLFIIGAISYFFLLYFLGGIKKNDLLFLKTQ